VTLSPVTTDELAIRHHRLGLSLAYHMYIVNIAALSAFVEPIALYRPPYTQALKYWKTRNAWQSLAYSPLGATVSSPGRYQRKITALPPGKRTYTYPIADACSTQLNSGDKR